MKLNLMTRIYCIHISLFILCMIDVNAQDVFHKYEDSNYIDVGNIKQLFVDDFLIESKKSIDFVMNPPYQTGEILLEADSPHEKDGFVGLYSSVLKESDGRIQVWYDFIRQKSDDPYDHDRHVGYAESTDGMNFVKPDLELDSAYGYEKNNVVIPGVIGGSSVWIDPLATPEHRYKTQAKTYPRDDYGKRLPSKFHMHSSPDGIKWNFYSEIAPRGPTDTQNIIFWDKNLNKYLLFSRERIYGRSVRRAEMKDLSSNIENTGLVVWTDITDQYIYFSDRADKKKPEDIQNDVPMDYYGATVFPYENVYIMLAQAFWHWKGTGGRDLRPGMRDVRLLISRDSKEFKRIGSRKKFMGPGPSGRFDSKQIWVMPNPIVMDDEIWIYYSGRNWDRTGRMDPDAPDGKRRAAISLAIMRLDGFVSVDAPYEGGEIITKPIKFKGDKLEINADTGAGGSIRVEILDKDGYPIPGFSIDESYWIIGNSVRFPASWKSDKNLKSINGETVRLRFVMRDCKLYSFQFK